ncbi:unnamed protein product [Somion occarium]|uniref:Uncharacterized protein n=1 Tax=Somion occarium TaxID=3059160 RepID=A0ABP1CXF8_9APHY
MPPPRSWTSPPTRREITLLLFSFTIFVLSYNLETSLRVVGVSPTKLNAGYLSTLGFGSKDPGLEPDGRRPVEWRDELEKLIVGEWEWKQGQIASVEHAQESLFLKPLPESGEVSTYIYKAGAGKTASRSATREAIGVGLTKGVSIGEQFVRWGERIPETRALVHVPGYTIFENLFVLNGTFYLVADKPSSLPPLGSIASSLTDRSQAPTPKDWRIISKEEASTLFGSFGGRIFGTSWLTTDPADAQDPYTLFSLYRTHSSLLSPHSSGAFTSSSGLRIIPAGTTGIDNVSPPVRLIFPSVPSFSSPGLPPADANPKTHPPLRIKSYNVFPTMGILYSEDWKDYVDMHVAYMYDRIIVADSGAAERGREQWTVGWIPPAPKKSGNNGELRRRDEEFQVSDTREDVEARRRAEEDQAGKPVWAAPFVGLNAPDDWWTPVREALLSYLRLPSDFESSNKQTKTLSTPPSRTPILTYVSMQMEAASAGPRLRTEDHAALLRGLRKLEKDGVLGGVNVVRGNGSMDVWEDRMSAIAQSSIVIGPYGPHLADSVFMPAPLPSSPSQEGHQSIAPVLMEFFPPGMFRRDQEYAVRSLGSRYIAWWNERKFAGNSLPPVMGFSNERLPHLNGVEISLDTDVVIQAIREEARRIGYRERKK